MLSALGMRGELVGMVCAMAASAPAHAADWWLVAAGKQGSSAVFVDRSTVKPAPAGESRTFQAWSAAQFASPRRDGTQSTKEFNYFDCERRNQALKSWIDYDADGDVRETVTRQDQELSWTPIAPATISEAQLTFVCNAHIPGSQGISFEVDGMAFEAAPDMEATAARVLRTQQARTSGKQTPKPR